MRIDYNGEVIPWYERPLAGGFNYIWEEKPVAPPVPEIQQYIANETYIQEKMQEGNGGIGGFLTNVVNPILDPMAADPIKTAAMLAASVFAPELIPLIAGADTAIAGGSVEDVLKSAATAYVGQQIGTAIGGAIGGENIGLPSETPYVDLPDGEVLLSANVPPPALPDDASRLAQMLKEFENPIEYGPTIDVASKPSVILENFIDTEVPLMPSNMQSDILYRSPLTDFSPNVDIQDLPQELDITGSLANPYTSPTFPTLDVSPEYNPSAYLPTNLGGFDNIPSNVGTNLGGYTGVPTDLGGLDIPFDTTTPTDLSAGELTVTGDRPYVPFEENFPLPYEPFEEDFPLQTETTTETAPLTKPKLLSNILKSSLPQAVKTAQSLKNAQASQQQSNLANILRSTQMLQTALPSIYKQANPFNFGQQNQPVQDTNALVKLLRTA